MEEHTKKNLHESLQKELESIDSETLLSPAYQKKKLKIWAIRTVIAIVLYAIFWKYDWVRKTVWFYIPLNLFGLSMIFLAPYLLKKKIADARSRIDNIGTMEDE